MCQDPDIRTTFIQLTQRFGARAVGGPDCGILAGPFACRPTIGKDVPRDMISRQLIR
jgi:hypothetical protein